jgi:arginase family enzyme
MSVSSIINARFGQSAAILHHLPASITPETRDTSHMITASDIILIGAPVDSGKRRRGCLMGPDAFRVAGLLRALARRASRFPYPRQHAQRQSARRPAGLCNGRAGFATGYFPISPRRMDPRNVCMMGIRSVDPAEREALTSADVLVHDMRAIDEHGVAPLLDAFLKRVAAGENSPRQPRRRFPRSRHRTRCRHDRARGRDLPARRIS